MIPKLLAVSLSLPLAVIPLLVRAEGGRIEINAACAAIGCFAGDTAGYPVSITQPGSYVLTSDLVLPASTSGITVLTDDVHIDLNGFAIRGPATCVQGACTQSASPRLVGVGRPTFGTGQGKRCSVRNGAVLGIDGNGVALTNVSQVTHVQVASVTGVGIEMSGKNALVESCSVDSTGSSGIAVAGGLPGFPGVVRDNVLSNTGLGIGGPAIAGARSGGTGNSCDDGSCTQLRRYYLTTGTSTGDAALTACDSGFHMASLWEIHEPSALSYDTRRGALLDDSGSGPPSALEAAKGWIRTGADRDFSTPGQANCLAWSPTTGGFGTWAALFFLPPLHTVGGDTEPRWDWSSETCSSERRVWCVED